MRKENFCIVKEHPDYEAFRKSIFRLKLDGTYDALFRVIYLMGFTEGHEFGKLMGTVITEDLEEAYAEFKVWLDDQLQDEKPT